MTHIYQRWIQVSPIENYLLKISPKSLCGALELFGALVLARERGLKSARFLYHWGFDFLMLRGKKDAPRKRKCSVLHKPTIFLPASWIWF